MIKCSNEMSVLLATGSVLNIHVLYDKYMYRPACEEKCDKMGGSNVGFPVV